MIKGLAVAACNISQHSYGIGLVPHSTAQHFIHLISYDTMPQFITILENEYCTANTGLAVLYASYRTTRKNYILSSTYHVLIPYISNRIIPCHHSHYSRLCA